MRCCARFTSLDLGLIHGALFRPLVRKMISFIGVDQARVRYIVAKPGTRYKLKNCVMLEFGPPPRGLHQRLRPKIDPGFCRNARRVLLTRA